MSDIRDQIAEHLRFYGELGVAGVSTDTRWSTRAAAAAAADDARRASPGGERAADAAAEPATVFASGAEALAAIKEAIGPACTRCKLHTLGRKQVVFGVGNPDADLMFVG